MPKRSTKTTRYTTAPPAPHHNSSDSENSDVEERSHSRTSTSSVEEESVKGVNGNGTRTVTTTTTTRTYSSSSGSSSSSSEKETSTLSSGFIARVSSIPLIHDSVSTLTSIAKDNKYGRYALNTAGSAVETVNKYTEGYQTRLQPHLQSHISKVDHLANRSLDIFENTFPIVTKPTSEIVTQVKKPYVYVEETSKNAYTQIQSTLDARVAAPVKSVTSRVATTAASTRDSITTAASSTANTITARANSTRDSITSTAVSTRDTITAKALSTRDTVTAKATSTRNTITGAATSTANSITTAATSTATTIAGQVNSRATPLVDGLETIVNRYLPGEGQQTTAAQTNQATRVVDLGRNVTERVSRRVSVRVAPITQKTQELREKAEKHTVVVKSKDSLQALNARLTNLLETLQSHAKELQVNVQKVPAEASSRVSVLSTKVLAEIDSLSVYLKEHSPALPEYVQVRLQPLVSFVNDRYVVVRGEIVKKDVSAVQKARNILHLTTEETLPILQNAAQDIRQSLVHYQITVQETVHKGYTKVQEVNATVVSRVSSAASSVNHNARYILAGNK